MNDEEISYHNVAQLHNVNTATWPTVPRRRGSVMFLAECVKLEFWVDQTEVRTTCRAADCVTPEKYKPALEDEAEPAEPSVSTMERKQLVDSKLDKLETGMTWLQDTQGNQMGMMKLMLKAQNVPQNLINQYMRAGGAGRRPQAKRAPAAAKAHSFLKQKPRPHKYTKSIRIWLTTVTTAATCSVMACQNENFFMTRKVPPHELSTTLRSLSCEMQRTLWG